MPNVAIHWKMTTIRYRVIYVYHLVKCPSLLWSFLLKHADICILIGLPSCVLTTRILGRENLLINFVIGIFLNFTSQELRVEEICLPAFDEVKGSIAMAELPSNVRGIKARRGAKDNFWKTIEHFHKLCFSSETREVISIVKDRTSQQEEALQVTASKHISNAENILNTYLIGYLEVLTPEEFHALHYLGYNSLFSRPVGGMSEFYVLFGPVVFCNHSEKSKIVFRVSYCTEMYCTVFFVVKGCGHGWQTFVLEKKN